MTRRFLAGLFAVLFCVSSAFAGGTIEWTEVKARIAKTDPLLPKMVERDFKVSPGGMAVRIGYGEHVGQRVPPYWFYAVRKSSGETYLLEFQESDDYECTKRFKFTARIATPEELAPSEKTSPTPSS